MLNHQTRAGLHQKRAGSDKLCTDEESTAADHLRTEESTVAEQLCPITTHSYSFNLYSSVLEKRPPDLLTWSDVPWSIQVVNLGICTSKQGSEREDLYNGLIFRTYPHNISVEYVPHENRTREAGEVIPTSPQDYQLVCAPRALIGSIHMPVQGISKPIKLADIL
ncbi:Pentatricopeptide repeat-containing protein [Dorcoceras hygrometricum]|uniref:Pentatricopeptide repeat-containing protein n=1 Tax=Dorcoceras hygrometricum TaxID=472368 RepID=A0A2Z7CVP6_9LAMI|nr:Pentatricopeptide repeat-containing protein [Dorcoceras hygrometricum]